VLAIGYICTLSRFPSCLSLSLLRQLHRPTPKQLHDFLKNSENPAWTCLLATFSGPSFFGSGLDLLERRQLGERRRALADDRHMPREGALLDELAGERQRQRAASGLTLRRRLRQERISLLGLATGGLGAEKSSSQRPVLRSITRKEGPYMQPLSFSIAWAAIRLNSAEVLSYTETMASLSLMSRALGRRASTSRSMLVPRSVMSSRSRGCL